MKIKYLIVTLILISFTTIIHSQFNINGISDGREWKKLEEFKENERLLKFIYLMALRDGEIFFKSLNYDNIEKIEEEFTYWSYSGITFEQYIDGLNEFYEDYRNMKIPIPVAMRIVKHEIEGTSQKEIDKKIRIFRKTFSEN